jgi:uncharacterized protein YcbK (DUF882 family)
MKTNGFGSLVEFLQHIFQSNWLGRSRIDMEHNFDAFVVKNKIRATKLSKHFTIAETVKSETAIRKSIDNTPDNQVISNLTALCKNIMEPIREHYGIPIRVTSGYRCVQLNRAIGGSSRSQHCALNGDAAIDFEFYDMSVDLEKVFLWITRESKLPFDQCIAEFLPTGWIHISYSSDGDNRKKITRAEKINGKTRYVQLGNADWA